MTDNDKLMDDIRLQFEAIRDEAIAHRHTNSEIDPYRVTAKIEYLYGLDERLRAVLQCVSAIRYLQSSAAGRGFIERIQANTILRDGIKNALDGRSTGFEWMTVRHRYRNNRDGPHPPDPAPHDRRCAGCGAICPTGFTQCHDHRDPLAVAPVKRRGAFCVTVEERTKAERYAAGTQAEYPEITEEWRQVRLRAQLVQAWTFGRDAGLSTLREENRKLRDALEKIVANREWGCYAHTGEDHYPECNVGIARAVLSPSGEAPKEEQP